MAKALQGQLLLASARLLDPNFVRSVLLMVQHDENGALGLILNRPLELTIQQACEKALELSCRADGVIHQGGPCEGPLMVVHTYEDSAQLEVVDGVYFTAEREHIESVLGREDAKARFFVGYAGWGPGQLEKEMETGSWVPLTLSKESLFADDPLDWSRLMARATLSQYIDPSHIPEDPTVN